MGMGFLDSCCSVVTKEDAKHSAQLGQAALEPTEDQSSEPLTEEKKADEAERLERVMAHFTKAATAGVICTMLDLETHAREEVEYLLESSLRMLRIWRRREEHADPERFDLARVSAIERAQASAVVAAAVTAGKVTEEECSRGVALFYPPQKRKVLLIER